MTGTYPPMPLEIRSQLIGALKVMACSIAAGQVSTIAAVTVPVGGGPSSSLCGAEYGSDVAEMVLEILTNHFKCDCGDPKCVTDVTRASLMAILEAYLVGDDAPRKAS